MRFVEKVSCLVCLLALAPWGGAARADIALAERGDAATIVSNGHAAQAAILADYLQRITGVEPPVELSTDDIAQGPAIVLDIQSPLPGAGAGPAAGQAYRIFTEVNRIYLVSTSDLGLTYAVYGFLEDHLGVRFFAPGDEVVPHNPELTVGEIDEVCVPAFAYRGHAPETAHALKNRGGGPVMRADRTLAQWLPADRYFAAHPEWYPLRGGKRLHGTGLCATNAALAGELAAVLMAAMAKADPTEPLSVAPDAGYAACRCAECRALVKAEGTEAAPIMLLLNRALDITTRQYPLHTVITRAAGATLTPPKQLRPHGNLWIAVEPDAPDATRRANFFRRLFSRPSRPDGHQALEVWAKLAPGRVAVATTACAGQDGCPRPFALRDEIRYWREIGVAAVHPPAGAGDDGWAPLCHWLWAKLLWNPDADVEALTDAFLAGYYGPRAAPHLREYLQYAAGAAGEHPSRISATHRKHLQALLRAARAAAATSDDPRHARHVNALGGL